MLNTEQRLGVILDQNKYTFNHETRHLEKVKKMQSYTTIDRILQKEMGMGWSLQRLPQGTN